MTNSIANIKEVLDIPLADLVVGLGQVRQKEISKNIEELQASIQRVGLLEPIVVTETEEPGQYQILTGQRRFLAHRNLKLPTIKAVVLDRAVDEIEAKVISLTENIVRADLGRPDSIDAFTFLYHKYGTIKDVAEATGISASKVSSFVKFDQLIPELKEAVQKSEVTLPAALKAQRAASSAATSTGQEVDADEAIKLAREMSNMSGAQAKRLEQVIITSPTASIDDSIEDVKTQGVHQIIVSLSTSMHQALQAYASSEESSQDDAAASLIEQGLVGQGFLPE